MAETQATPRARLAWAFADFAREPFFSFVLSLIFPPFFVNVLAGDPVLGTAYWGYGLSATSVLLVLTAPVAGSFADATGTRRPWLVGTLVLATAALSSLWYATAQPGHLLWVLASVGAAQLAIEWSRVFTDSLLPQVSTPGDVGALSGLAVGLGFGASLLYMVLGYLAGAPDSPDTARLLSVGSGGWLVMFMLPCLLACPQPEARLASPGTAASRAFTELRTAWSRLRRQRGLRQFLIARMVYWDGTMSLFSFLAIVAATQLHWGTRAMTTFGIAGLIAGAAAGLLAGRFEARLGSRRTLAFALLTLLMITLVLALALARPIPPPAGLFARPIDRLFLGLAVLACAALSLVMASSRTLLVRLAAPSRLGEAFGLYVMVGRASSFLAPLLVALAITMSGDQRAGVFGVASLMLATGIALLLRVSIPSRSEVNA